MGEERKVLDEKCSIIYLESEQKIEIKFKKGHEFYEGLSRQYLIDINRVLETYNMNIVFVRDSKNLLDDECYHIIEHIKYQKECYICS